MNSKKITAGLLAVLLTVGSAAIPETVCLEKFSSVTASAADSSLKYEAEQAQLSGSCSIVSRSGYSGGSAVKMEDSGKVTFNITVSTAGSYDISVVSEGEGGDKINICSVNGTEIGELKSTKSTLSTSTFQDVDLEAGSNTLTISKSWGWIYIDYIQITPSSQSSDEMQQYYNVDKKLVNENATDSTKRLYAYMKDIYGDKILSGQQTDCSKGGGGYDGYEMKTIRAKNGGKTPAICGFDFMDYSPGRGNTNNAHDTEKAIEFAQKGGIVTFCWHWNAPSWLYKSETDENQNPTWWGGFYSDKIDTSKLDIDSWIDGSDTKGKEFLDSEIDAIADQLLILQNNDVPVLFRPLHEAKGNEPDGKGAWFWWGSNGPESYKKLWKYMYEKFQTKGVNNVIWICNCQDANWYPGDEYVDIVSYDIYAGKNNYSPQAATFKELTNYGNENKLIALSENGVLFDIDKAFNQGIKWSYFCVWDDKYVGNTYTSDDMWEKVYTDSRVVTLDSLPDLKTYPLSDESPYSLTLDKTSETILLNKEMTLKATTDYTGGITWSSSDESVCTVDQNGKVKALKPGSAAIYVKLNDGSKRAQCTVKVEEASLTIDQTKGLKLGEQDDIEYSTNTDSKIEWSSSDESICKVDQSGTITSVSPGKVIITGKLTDYPNVTASCEVTIKTKISDATVTVNDSVYTGKAVTPELTVKFGGKVLKKGTDYTVAFSNNVQPGVANITISGAGFYTHSMSAAFIIKPQSVTAKKTASAATSASFSWTESEGVEGYTVLIYKNGKWVTLGKTSDTSYKVSGLTAGTSYTFAVKPYITVDGSTVYGETSKVVFSTSAKVTAPKQVTVKKTAVNASSASFSWSKSSGASGYKVLVYKNGKWVTLGTTAKTSYTVKSLKAGTSYVFAVKPYKKTASATVYGLTSKVNFYTNPAVPTKLTVKSTKAKTAAVSWAKASGATGYQVQITSSSKLTGGSVSATKNLKLTKTKLTSKKVYYVRVRAYKIVGKTKYYSAWSAAKKIKVK